MDQAYKSQLQSYALKQNLELPAYATEREGPPHAPRFRSKVTFCGTTYQSPDFFPTLKASEHAAAKIALDSIVPPPQSPEANAGGVVGVGVAYKNLLQEIAQKGNSLLPVYETAATGPSHAPTFTSSVEFNGKVFKGEEAKTKKLAEMSAAKIAYMSIKYGNSNQTPIPNPNANPNPIQTSLPPCERREEAATKIVSPVVKDVPSQQHPIKIVTPDVPSKWVEVYIDDDQEINIDHLSVPKNPTLNARVEKTNIAASSSSNNGNLNGTEKMDVTVASTSQKNGTTNGNEALEPCVELEVEEEGNEKKKIKFVPNGSRVLVRPNNSELILPQDAEVLFSDDRFVAYRLVNL